MNSNEVDIQMTAEINPVIPTFDNRGPIFKIGSSAVENIRLYINTVIKQEDKDFMKAVIQYASYHGKLFIDDGADTGRKLNNSERDEVFYLIDIEQLRAATNLSDKRKVGLSKASLATRLNRLQEMGIFNREIIKVPSKNGRLYQYTLQPLDTILDTPLPQSSVITKPPKVRNKDYYQKLKLKDEELLEADAQLLIYPGKLGHAYSERLLNNVFFACGRQSVRDSRTDLIETFYPFQGELVKITATSGGNTDIYSLDDQNTVLAVITMVIYTNKERMELGRKITNEYFLDIVDLCKICGLSSDGANRTTFRKSLDRLYFTNLNVVCPPHSKFAEFFGLDSTTDNGERFSPDNLDFRFLWSRDSVAEIEDDLTGDRLPRKYRISLHPLIFTQLLDQDVWNTFVINPSLLKNRLKMITHLYFFASRLIARDPTRIFSFPIKAVQKQIMPAIQRYQTWQTALLNECSKFAEKTNQTWIKDGENTLDIYGYFIKVAPHYAHGYKLTFWFNQDDPILGKDGLIQKAGLEKLQPDLFALTSDVNHEK